MRNVRMSKIQTVSRASILLFESISLASTFNFAIVAIVPFIPSDNVEIILMICFASLLKIVSMFSGVNTLA